MASNPWQALISTWQSAGMAFWRLPLLVVASFLFYTVLSAFWLRDFPLEIQSRLISQIGYYLLHAVVFVPLISAIILMIVRGNIHYSDIWTPALVFVGAVIVVREFAIYAMTWLLHAFRTDLPQGWLGHGAPADINRLAAVYMLTNVILLLAIFLPSIRLILLLPESVLGGLNWKSALRKAWGDMRGSYGFALAVSCAALGPLLVADYFLARLYRKLYEPQNRPVPLSLQQWEALMVRSAELTLGYIMTAALAGCLYNAIHARRSIALN